MLAAGATFIAMLFVWFYHPESRVEGTNLFEYTLKAFIMAVTIVVVAVPEGLPLAVTLSLAFSTQKMMADNNLIRVLSACETMGNATNICSDKTGTLTQNRMTVVESWIGGASHAPFPSNLPGSVLDFITSNSAINSTATMIKDSSGGIEILGNKTEGALLILIDGLGVNYSSVRTKGFNAEKGDRMFTFTSDRKCMSVLQIAQETKSATLFTKGASEVVVSKCTFYMDSTGSPRKIDQAKRKEIDSAISSMARKSLRTVALTHRTFTSVPSQRTAAEDLESDLILDCIVGIKDPLRPDVKEAVRTCQEAGILVRMVTGDNLETAKAIAEECGILTPGGICLEGPQFRALTPKQLDEILPKIQVLARSSPTDKFILVSRLNGSNLPDSEEKWLASHPEAKNYLKQRDLLLPGYKEEWEASRKAMGSCGEVVGVTGDGTNDGPALKVADVGLSMGLSGTEGKLSYLQCHYNVLPTCQKLGLPFHP